MHSSMCGLYLFGLHWRNGLDGAFFRITASQGLDNRPVAYIEYWNLNLDKFEPLLERVQLRGEAVPQAGELREQPAAGPHQSEKDCSSYDYRNRLCLNLTTTFFHLQGRARRHGHVQKAGPAELRVRFICEALPRIAQELLRHRKHYPLFLQSILYDFQVQGVLKNCGTHP